MFDVGTMMYILVNNPFIMFIVQYNFDQSIDWSKLYCTINGTLSFVIGDSIPTPFEHPFIY